MLKVGEKYLRRKIFALTCYVIVSLCYPNDVGRKSISHHSFDVSFLVLGYFHL